MSEQESNEKKKGVVKGEVIQPKESTLKHIYHIFFATEPKDVLRGVVTRVILPDIQYSLNNIWKRSGEILFYGIDEKPSARRGRKTIESRKTSYNSMYRDDSRKAFQNEASGRGSRVDEFKDWAFTSRADVEDIILGLEEDINEYDAVTVGRLYELVDLPNKVPEAIHFDWGWRKGDEFDYECGRDGLWHIIYPRLKRMA